MPGTIWALVPETDLDAGWSGDDDIIHALDRFVFVQFDDAVDGFGRFRQRLNDQAGPVGDQGLLVERRAEDADIGPSGVSGSCTDADVADESFAGVSARPRPAPDFGERCRLQSYGGVSCWVLPAADRR